MLVPCGSIRMMLVIPNVALHDGSLSVGTCCALNVAALHPPHHLTELHSKRVASVTGFLVSRGPSIPKAGTPIIGRSCEERSRESALA